MIPIRTTLLLCLLALTVAGCGGTDEATGPAGPYSRAYIWAGTGLNAAGDENLPPTETHLSLPYSLSFHPDGRAFILDWNSHRVRMVDQGITRTIIGTGELGDARPGLASETKLNHPTDISFGPDGYVYLCAWHNTKIMRMDLSTGILEDYCGDGRRAFGGDGGPVEDALVHLPVDIEWTPDGVAIVMDEVNQRVRKIDNGIITTIAGTGQRGGAQDEDGIDALDASFNFPVGQMGWPAGSIDLDEDGRIYIPDALNNKVRVIDVDGKMYTVAGNGEPGFQGDGGPAKLAQLRIPGGVAVGPDGNIYIADTFNHCVRRIVVGHTATQPAPGVTGVAHLLDAPIETVCGTCGSLGSTGGAGENPLDTRLFNPTNVVFDASENMYIVDQRNNRILMLPKSP